MGHKTENLKKNSREFLKEIANKSKFATKKTVFKAKSRGKRVNSPKKKGSHSGRKTFSPTLFKLLYLRVMEYSVSRYSSGSSLPSNGRCPLLEKALEADYPGKR